MAPSISGLLLAVITLQRGRVGSDVSEWQTFLKTSHPEILVDGRFGPKTEAATRRWQEANNLTPNGIVGPETWKAAGIEESHLPNILKGVDLSAVQGLLADETWRALADTGIRFAIMRAVVGNEKWTDGSAKENGRRARAHGIVTGAYVFPYPLPHLDPISEAENYVRNLEAMGHDIADLPPAFDVEWPPKAEWKKKADGTKELVYPWKKWGCSPPQLRDWIARCLGRCEELTGCTWIVYSYPNWLESIEAEKLPELAHRPLWLANYQFAGRWPTGEQLKTLRVPKPWTSITIVQHDGNGGMRLPTGADADFNCLLGGEEKLAELVRSRKGLHEPLAVVSERTIADYRRTRVEEDLA